MQNAGEKLANVQNIAMHPRGPKDIPPEVYAASPTQNVQSSQNMYTPNHWSNSMCPPGQQIAQPPQNLVQLDQMRQMTPANLMGPNTCYPIAPCHPAPCLRPPDAILMTQTSLYWVANTAIGSGDTAYNGMSGWSTGGLPYVPPVLNNGHPNTELPSGTNPQNRQPFLPHHSINEVTVQRQGSMPILRKESTHAAGSCGQSSGKIESIGNMLDVGKHRTYRDMKPGGNSVSDPPAPFGKRRQRWKKKDLVTHDAKTQAVGIKQEDISKLSQFQKAVRNIEDSDVKKNEDPEKFVRTTAQSLNPQAENVRIKESRTQLTTEPKTSNQSTRACLEYFIQAALEGMESCFAFAGWPWKTRW
ncbi:hypothetical protein CROQUDRAFT_135182 [Cronartium quercuum f. sp. fusiforme G11]|uniref:Uncharacterized protein n=1 Tax=Cronartium quercuum f. sp. fusiforme G11 TaxID=708437 RepID=A0A9P6T8I8_9BASI|nr:hypothetical protein CROQUDRAFT_135182 [Cronartium quercuum f. sp. fusiforme G11]